MKVQGQVTARGPDVSGDIAITLILFVKD